MENDLMIQEETSILPSRLDPAAIETWLEDHARDGWQLTGFDYRFWRTAGDFVWSEPRPTRYRLTPLARNEKEPEEERRELCEAQGWHYAATISGGYHVWRTDDASAPEMDTDPVTQAEGYRYLRRRAWLGNLPWILLLAVVAGIWAYPLTGTGFFLGVTMDIPFRMLISLSWLVGAVAEMAYEVYALRRLYRRLHTGIPLDRPVPYKRKQAIRRGLQIAWIVSYFYFIGAGSLLGMDEYQRIDNNPEALARAKYLTLADVGSAPEGDTDPRVEHKWTELYPEMYKAWEGEYVQTSASSWEEVRKVRTEYYRAWTPWLAEQLERDLLRQIAYDHERHPEWFAAVDPCPAPGLDAFYWGICPSSDPDREDVQQAVVRLGNQVLTVEYDGAEDLRNRTDAIAEALAGFLDKKK